MYGFALFTNGLFFKIIRFELLFKFGSLCRFCSIQVLKGRIDENERQRNDLVQANTDLKSENEKLQNQVKELEGMPFNQEFYMFSFKSLT